ncbi:hypothetical protein BCR43DRAFT_550571 [Syncephalastrum racemosum]|uniref:Uncharacterized protein n=1 Tax=Syncephalastrum racemosum TaxID=13706 RepID=A0A1X2H7Q2_SYNRA|nr:hypothetical protein BCR43DRAFT_550571 [Syncephalastrum racemosum]
MALNKKSKAKGKERHRKRPFIPTKQESMMSQFHINDDTNEDIGETSSPAYQGKQQLQPTIYSSQTLSSGLLEMDLEAHAEQHRAWVQEREYYCMQHELLSSELAILQYKPESHNCAILLSQNMDATASWYAKLFREEENFAEQEVKVAVAAAEARAKEQNDRAASSHHRGESMPSCTSVRDMAMMFNR